MKKEEYWKILNKTTDWIKHSDTKAVVVLTVYGIIITIIYSNSKEILEHLNNSSFSVVLTLLAAILGLISVLFSFLTINPRLKNPNSNSIIYFGHIQEKHKTFNDFYEHSQGVLSDENKYEKQLAEQVYVNSKIAWRKFKNVTYSIRLFFVSISILLVILITYFT
jgi:predicted PurR-regulated permease PerM